MVIEIDEGTFIETESMSAVNLSPTGQTSVVVDSVTYNVTRFSFEMLLQTLRQREAQTTELAY